MNQANDKRFGGLARWLLSRMGRGPRREPRLALLERITLGPRQNLSLIEADGRRVLVATSGEGTPAFHVLDEATAPKSKAGARLKSGNRVGDSALGSVITQLTQAISVATAANNGTMDASQLQSASNELTGIRDEVTSLANSRYQGQYIFGGGQTATAPFTTSSTTPATTTYNGDGDVNYLQAPNGQTIQLNVPGNQIFTASGSNNVFAALNNLIADYASGTSTGAAVQDTQALNTALNYVSQQRVTLDNSMTQLTSASDAVTSEQTQLTATQTNLMQADLPQISTQLSLAETQQTALEDVISQLGSGSLFNKLS